MIDYTGDNIISALGFTTEENYQAVKDGLSGISFHNSTATLPEAYQAAIINREQLHSSFAQHCSSDPDAYTDPEKAAILSALTAAAGAGIDLSSPDVLFIISSTKGNIHLLDLPDSFYDARSLYLWHSARQIASFFGNTNEPVTVSNACISGLCAQIAAMRELSDSRYKYAVVTGVDLLSRFIISGFQSLKALSPAPCRPFDISRNGLNLGEAAATIIYKKRSNNAEDNLPHDLHKKQCLAETKPLHAKTLNSSRILLVAGSVTNDANHISGPSRTGEGSLAALTDILQYADRSEIAFISAHGTATPYNDHMEAAAITRAGLNEIPVNSLKAFFGHTLGAAGILESIISTQALLDNNILPVPNFEQCEDEYPLVIPTENTPTQKQYFIKMMSGFGGCNAALLFQKTEKDGLVH